MSKAILEIQRFNPDTDQKPYLDKFEIEYTADTTILDALEQIKMTVDGTLTYRRSCRHAICGSCAMNVNGRNRLVCDQPVANHVQRNGRLTIRPLPALPILKDLVVDRSRFWEQYLRIKPWLMPPDNLPEKEFRISPEEVAALHEAEKCIMCGACFSACPITSVSPNYIGPHALLKQYLRVADPRDSELSERLDTVENQDGIYGCRTATPCLEDCPKGLNPTQAISTLRQMALKRQKLEEQRRQRQAQFSK